MSSFTLLDDSDASAAQPTSRLYTDLQQVLSCTDAAQFSFMLEQMQAALQQGLYAVAVFSYELGVELQGLDSGPAQPSSILLYRQCQHLSHEQVGSWLQQQSECVAEVAGIAGLRSSVDEDEFTRAIERIQRYIASGDTYQVNYTFRLHFTTYGSICALYRRLRERQSVPYGALIAMPDGSAMLSLSPELFVRHSQGKLSARPMKGTAAASNTCDATLNQQLNTQRSEHLSLDVKNRAENLMIVDLLRNDLGRIAQLGSVQVPKLFEVQRFNSVLQMTSSVTAQLRADVNLTDLFLAIYPCGSITGAPKIRTMQIIQEVETETRGIYTGAIGWFDPTQHSSYGIQNIPDFCLSVPIRTLHLQAPQANGNRRGVMGVGAGIVFDSVAADEYQECQLKARFLTDLPAQFALFETMYATKENGCRHVERHLQRLAKSTHYFGLPLHVSDIEQQLQTACAALPENIPHRLKLSVDGTGQIQIQSAVLAPLTMPVKVLFASAQQQTQNLWLQHKTTQRAEYDQAWQMAESQGAFDMLFCNERGELTEGGRTNLLVKIDGRWITPPLSAGVLPGVMRSVLMDDPAWALTERSISVELLMNAEEIAVCNALRGVLTAQLVLI
ncbi:chorismate-binding protein [Solimicrobium silvestre]|uniref:Chorismate binding enzyme n=1 Tax=Solimicrobium silvestre TaxID=2099400 RepID=A0A2S9H3F0_9BURK|nr:chorismate-binding protein [Solimicrobium silvestre]PRC94463.1 chorismate binding enzyme [Solimicrobium silvestre]